MESSCAYVKSKSERGILMKLRGGTACATADLNGQVAGDKAGGVVV